MPTFSCPWMMGNGVERSYSVPAYCSVSPRNVCLSVPQIPDASMRSSTAPGSSSSGYGYSRTSSRPGASSVAAWTEVTRATLLVVVPGQELGIGDQEHAGDDEGEQRQQAEHAGDDVLEADHQHEAGGERREHERDGLHRRGSKRWSRGSKSWSSVPRRTSRYR